MEEGKSVAYYSRKLTDAQKKTTQQWKKNLLAIGMALRELRSMYVARCKYKHFH